MNANSVQFGALVVAKNDLDLVHACKNGDAAAFEQLVSRYDRKLLRIAETITHNREDSQDAAQEAYLKAFRNLGDFREDSQFATCLTRITLSQALMKQRKRRSIKEVSLDENTREDEDFLPFEIAAGLPIRKNFAETRN